MGRRCCCGAGECDLECVCSTCKNQQAPCCWEITIDGMEEGTCGSCTGLNRSYYVSQNADNSCRWSQRCAFLQEPCDPTEISLEVSDLGDGNYRMTVTLGSHTWVKDFKEPPDCCISHSLTHSATSGDCDSSSATCVVTPFGNDLCPSECCEDYCADGAAPDCLKVTLNITKSLYSCQCDGGKTYYVPIFAPCHWKWADPSSPCSELYFTTGIDIVLSFSGGHYYLTATVGYLGIFRADLGMTKPTCAELDVTLTYLSDASICYDTGTTIRVEAAHGCAEDGSDFSIPEKMPICDQCGLVYPDELQLVITSPWPPIVGTFILTLTPSCCSGWIGPEFLFDGWCPAYWGASFCAPFGSGPVLTAYLYINPGCGVSKHAAKVYIPPVNCPAIADWLTPVGFGGTVWIEAL